MKTNDLSKISFSPYHSYIPKPKNKPVMSIDTETGAKEKDGHAFLMCAYHDGIAEYIEIMSAEDWLSYLFRKDMRGYITTGWNVRYDWNALIAWLPAHVLKQIACFEHAEWNGYFFHDYGGKFFRIRRGHKSVNIYDMSQFYARQSLDYCAHRFLNEKKIEENRREISREKFFSDPDYHDRLVRYCSHDAYLTHRLSVLFFNELKTAIPEIDYTKPISPAYFSGQLMKMTLPKRQEYPDRVNDMLLKAYKGGRFETIQKGYFENVFEYDLKSAYPSAMKDYVFSHDGSWIHTRDCYPNALYGVYEVLIDVPENNINAVCPIPVTSHQNVLIYPSGKIHAFVIKPELEFLERNGYTVDVIDAYEYFAKDEPKPLLRNLILRLYREKAKNKRKNEIRYQLYKVILNALYGKTLQLTVNDGDAKETNKLTDTFFINEDTLDMQFFEKKTKNYRAGALFNLYLGAYITALTRIKLFEFSKRYEDTVISYATDGVYMLKDIPINNDGIGSFEKNRYEKGIIYGNGIYIFDDKERTRGLQKHVLTNPNVERCAKDASLTVSYTKPLQLKESVKQNRLNEFNVFVPVSKTLDFSKDLKRVFTEHITFDTLQRHSFESYPLEIDEHYDDEKGIERVLRYDAEMKRIIRRELLHSDFADSTLEDEENMRILRPTLKDILYRDAER